VCCGRGGVMVEWMLFLRLRLRLNLVADYVRSFVAVCCAILGGFGGWCVRVVEED
jgi:hypothetical protein